MLKSILAFIGLIFFALLTLIGAGLTLAFFDASGIVDVEGVLAASKPAVTGGFHRLKDIAAMLDLSGLRETVSGLGGTPPPPVIYVDETPLPTATEINFEALVNRESALQHKSLVEGLPLPTLELYPTPIAFPTQTPLPPPTATPTPSPTPTPTPVPPLDPGVYRAEVLLRSRRFGTALDAFRDGNDRLGQNGSLLGDLTWLNEMTAVLDEVRAAGIALAEVGPPPGEYALIDALLDQVAVEAATLRNNYLQGLASGDSGYFAAASGNFDRIRQYMAQAVGEMAKAGWPLE
jgi:hypothetical protein